MMGFEAGGIMDVLLPLGPAQMFVTATAPFSINIGNLNAALITAFGSSPGTNANILTAVFGNLNPSDPNNTLYANVPHISPISGSGQSAISSLMSSVESEYNNEFMGNRAIVQDSSADAKLLPEQGRQPAEYSTTTSPRLNSRWAVWCLIAPSPPPMAEDRSRRWGRFLSASTAMATLPAPCLFRYRNLPPTRSRSWAQAWSRCWPGDVLPPGRGLWQPGKSAASAWITTSPQKPSKSSSTKLEQNNITQIS